MEYRDFAYWLQGFFEISNPTNLTEDQVKTIKQHLDLCFNKVTLTYPGAYGFASLPTNSYISTAGTCGIHGNASHGVSSDI